MSSLSRQFSIPKSSIGEILAKGRRYGLIPDKKKPGGQPRKLSCKHQEMIQSWYDEDCGILLKDAAEMVKISTGIEVSQYTIDKILRLIHYNIVPTYPFPEEKNDLDSLMKRHA
eukprot:TRINITY_DN7317_c0_g2_i5.p1 TRINITY_DN7317_c0_g2~~TRINITY_DN7317_c0_g2_i5.p1  ORF type:complete len:114 (-),score=8.45 TRINITY_DN7317_c0_g2_i5:125-466(-)